MIPLRSFTFNNIGSTTLYLICKSISRPILPSIRPRTVEVNSVSGIYDFGAITHKTRNIKMQIAWITSTDYVDYRRQVRDIAAWLDTATWSDLIINDEPDKLYKARVVGGVDLESLLKYGRAEINFECQPYACALWSTGTGYTLDTAEYPWIADYPMIEAEAYTVDLTAPGNLVFDNPGTRAINYQSPQDSKFLITIIGTFTTLSLALGGKTLNYNAALATGTLVFDNVEMEVYIGSTNKLAYVSGDYATFLSCVPGENALYINGTNLNVTVTVDIIPLWL